MANGNEIYKGLGKGRMRRGQLDEDTFRVKGDPAMADVTEPRTRVRGAGTERIDTKEIAPITGGEDFAQRQAGRSLKGDLRATARAAADAGDIDTLKKLKKIAQKMAKGARAVPGLGAVVGGVGALMGSEDASAAIPGLDTAESVGMSPEAEDMFMAERQGQKDYGQSQAAKDRARALARLAKLQE